MQVRMGQIGNGVVEAEKVLLKVDHASSCAVGKDVQVELLVDR